MKDNDIIIWTLVALVVIVALFGFPRMMGYDSYNYGYGMMSGWGFMSIFGPMFMILVTVALVLFIIWIAKQIQNTERRN